MVHKTPNQGELTPFNFTLWSGNDMRLEITVKDEADVLVDITGATITWGLYEDAIDGVELFTKTTPTEISIVDGPNGRADVAILRADTAALPGKNYYHEAEMQDSGGERKTVLIGTVRLRNDKVTPTT